METLTIQVPQGVESKTVKAVLKALGVTILKNGTSAASKTVMKRSKDADSPYDPEFVAMVKRGEQQIREGKTFTVKLEELWK